VFPHGLASISRPQGRFHTNRPTDREPLDASLTGTPVRTRDMATAEI
jgi:hypothetical protein